VTAFAFLNNNSLFNVTILDNYPAANNVSGPPLNGVPYNGQVSFFTNLDFACSRVSCRTRLCRLLFNTSTNINIQSRANAIKSGLPNAIFRKAQQDFGGLQSVFQNPNGFLDYTTQIYVCHRLPLLPR